MEKNNMTAVEWLVEKTTESGHLWLTDKPYGMDELSLIIEAAKQMEEEQHKETFKQSRQAKIFEKDMPPVWESFEQYYNITYKP